MRIYLCFLWGFLSIAIFSLGVGVEIIEEGDHCCTTQLYPNVSLSVPSLKKSVRVPGSQVSVDNSINSVDNSEHHLHYDAEDKSTVKTKNGGYFCGTPDPDSGSNVTRFKRYVLHGRKWEKKELTWAVTTPSTKYEVSSFAEAELSKAFGIWSKQSQLSFKRVHPHERGIDIIIKFIEGQHNDGYPFDGNGGTLAHAFYPGDGIGGDVHFDDSEEFIEHSVSKDSTGVSLLVTAAHEIGHSLGLRHSNEKRALMAPFYNEFNQDFSLPYDDMIAIQSLYGNPEHRKPHRTTQPTYTTRRTTTTTTRRPRTTLPWNKPTTTRTRKPITTTTTTTTTTYHPYVPPVPQPPPTDCELKPSEGDGLCSGNFDAATMLGKDLFLFKGEHVWRVGMFHSAADFGRYQIRQMWNELPDTVRHIDAAYTLERDEGVVLFAGSYALKLVTGENRVRKIPLIDMNVNASNIDAAWRWGHNGHIYLMSGEKYWRLGYDGKSQEDYPRDSAVWRSLPQNISASLTYEGVTYFFKENFFWEFDNLEMRAKWPPYESATFWLNCPNQRL